MKTKLIMLLLLYSCTVFGQKLLSEANIKPLPYLKDIKTQNQFYEKIKNADTDTKTFEILKKHLISQPLHIDIKNIVIDTLEYEKIYKYDGGEVYINRKDEIVYKIKIPNEASLFFYPKGSFFLQKAEENVKEKTDEKLVLESMQEKINSINYRCTEGVGIAIHQDVLAKNLTAIKKVVIFNSQDDATSNSALSFTNGSNDTKLNVGANFKYGNKWFYNIGINTLVSNSSLFYSKKAWKNDIGASFTAHYVLSKETQYFGKDDCIKLNTKREKYIDSLKTEYKIMVVSKLQLDEKKKELEKYIKDCMTSPQISYEESLKIKQNQKSILEIEKQIDEYEKIVADPSKYIDEKLSAFDSKNDILYGNYLSWAKFTTNINNQNLDLDSLNILIGDKITNIPKLNFNLSYNLQWQTKKHLTNFQVFTNISMGSFLDANVGTEKPYLLNTNNETYVFDSTGTQIGKYNMLKRAFWTSQTGLQATFFIVKSFGISGFTSHTFALQNLEETDYRNRYSLLGGFVFRINNQEDVNKATFRLLAGVENEPYKTKALDNFMVKITLGIPFNLFTKK